RPCRGSRGRPGDPGVRGAQVLSGEGYGAPGEVLLVVAFEVPGREPDRAGGLAGAGSGLGGAPADPAGGDAEGGDSRSGSGERRAASDLLGQGRTPCSVVVSCRQTDAGCAWSAAGRGAGRFVPTAGDRPARVLAAAPRRACLPV